MNIPAGGEAAPRPVLTVRELNEQIATALQLAFPRTVWLRGEVQRLPHDAASRQHVYFELHETGRSGAAEYAVAVAIMGWDRQKFGLGRYLDGTDRDLRLANQLEVCLECRVDFYPKFGKLTLKVVGIDPAFSLGRLEARRRQTLAFLAESGLLGANAALPLPELPLRVGLVTAPGSAAERDFLTGLEASRWAFRVVARGARMQGEQLEAEVIAALRHLQAEGVDVIVITRGGGSRADLSWFDQRDLAVAIAGCTVPVVTAIGHEIDRSIADEVAHHACKTPTAAAEFLVARVDAASARVDAAAAALAQRARDALREAGARLPAPDRLERAARGTLRQARLRARTDAARLQAAVTGRLAAVEARLADRRARLALASLGTVGRQRARLLAAPGRLVTGTGARLAAAGLATAGRTARLEREACRPLGAAARRLDALATQARLLDPARLLARGYTITTAPDGRALTTAAQAVAAGTLLTRFADGAVASRVAPATGGGDEPEPQEGARRGRKKTKPQARPGQEPLFR
ncbi:MAG: exodeoxyribonuclease VII large subunit [bacterium]|nr:exodeoxyribonuclease VII large subunit [bacterium]